MIYYNQAFHQGPARLTISMNCKGDGSMKANWIEDVKNNPLFSYQEYMPSSLDIAADTKMRPGFAAVLYQATCEDIAKFHQILSVNAGIDSVEDMECVPTYAIYQDTRGHIHQLYSYLEKSVDQQDGEGLPDHVATWLDQGRTHTAEVLHRRQQLSGDFGSGAVQDHPVLPYSVQVGLL